MKKILLILSIFFVLSACSKLEDLNTNPKGISSVPAGGVFNDCVRNFFEQMGTFNVNYNNTELYVQHFAETTYPDESHYDMITRTIPGNHVIYMYRLVLNQLKETKRILENSELGVNSQNERNNQLAVVEILSAYVWSNIVETFGDMPYSQALDYKIPTPAYDDGLTIYKNLITRIDAALATMTPTEGAFDPQFDNIYGGATDKWMRFANSLKLRMGLVLADVDNTTSVSAVNSAIAGIAGEGVFVEGDKFALAYYAADAANQNPVYTDVIASGRDDYVVTKSLVDPLNALNDPRRDGFLWTKINGQYIGGNQGVANTWSICTHIDKDRLLASREVVLLDYTEVEFLLAEAAARGGYTGVGVAATHYANAVTSSIIYWDGTSAQAAAYIAQPGVDYATLIGAGQPWKEVIGTQAYYAYYMRGMSAWLSWRRLDYPRLKASPESVLPGGKMPLRYIYPIADLTLNTTNYKAAAVAIGGDEATTPLFWDTKQYNTLTGADN